MKGTALPIVLTAIIALAGCASARQPDIYTTPGRSIEVAKGEQFRIRLHANKTTGYEWLIAEPLAAELKLHGSAYERENSARVGTGGDQIFVFEAVQPGRTTIRFDYARPWLKEREAAKSKTFTVIVK